MKTTAIQLKQDQEHLQLKRVVVPIVATSKTLDSLDPIGTAFIIYGAGKQAIAITAAHNIHQIARIDGHSERCHPTTPLEFRLREIEINFTNTEMRVLYPDENGQIYQPRLMNAYVIEDNDIAVCTLNIGSDAPNDLVFDKQFVFDSRPPKKGTAIMAIGYKEMSVTSPRVEGQMAIVKYTETLVRRPGSIVEVYPNQGPRNHQMPCFQCTTPFDNGMSGGPIVEVTDGKTVAIGVICSDMSFEFPHKGSGESALATILWPAMGVKLKHEKITPHVDGPTLLDFQRHRLIKDLGNSLDHIRISQDGMFISWIDFE